MKYCKKDETLYDIEEYYGSRYHDYKKVYKIRNIKTGQEIIETSIDKYICCETPKDRMVIEISELEDKISKLSAFLNTEKFNSLSDEHQSPLIKQDTIMKSYRDILRRRLELM